jgi:hypothetical protein
VRRWSGGSSRVPGGSDEEEELVRRLCALSAIAIVGSLLFAAQSSATSYMLTVTLAGSGGGNVTGGEGTISCPAECSEPNYTAGPLSLTATPNAYSLFGGWTGDCAFAGTSTTCVTTVGADTNVGATFSAVPTGPLPAIPHKKKCKKTKRHRAAAEAKKKCKKKRR